MFKTNANANLNTQIQADSKEADEDSSIISKQIQVDFEIDLRTY